MEEKSAYTYKQAPRPIRPEGSTIAPYSNPMYKVRTAAAHQLAARPPPAPAPHASHSFLPFSPRFLRVTRRTLARGADRAYDPETPGVMHHPDQIRVPTEIDAVLRLYTKAAVREQVEAADLVTWSRDWFDKKSWSGRRRRWRRRRRQSDVSGAV